MKAACKTAQNLRLALVGPIPVRQKALLQRERGGLEPFCRRQKATGISNPPSTIVNINHRRRNSSLETSQFIVSRKNIFWPNLTEGGGRERATLRVVNTFRGTGAARSADFTLRESVSSLPTSGDAIFPRRGLPCSRWQVRHRHVWSLSAASMPEYPSPQARFRCKPASLFSRSQSHSWA
jgi:hypothetical protein